MTDERRQPFFSAPTEPHDDLSGGEEREPLYDPYLTMRSTPPAPRLSFLAVAALVALLLGPLGALLAIVLGGYARREIERSDRRRTGEGIATAAMVLGIVALLGWGGLLSYAAWTSRYRFDRGGEGLPAARPSVFPHGPPRVPAPLLPSSPTATAVPRSRGPLFAPRSNTVHREGTITVVDLGMSSPSLSDALARQRAEAATAGEALVVMTTAAACAPCSSVDRALADALLQTALAKTRLVRIDVQVFYEELMGLKIPSDAIPSFFLLSLDLTPRDGITGGEWDDDIAPNIAPVLGAFVRGTYTKRRDAWQPLPPSGMTL